MSNAERDAIRYFLLKNRNQYIAPIGVSTERKRIFDEEYKMDAPALTQAQMSELKRKDTAVRQANHRIRQMGVAAQVAPEVAIPAVQRPLVPQPVARVTPEMLSERAKRAAATRRRNKEAAADINQQAQAIMNIAVEPVQLRQRQAPFQLRNVFNRQVTFAEAAKGNFDNIRIQASNVDDLMKAITQMAKNPSFRSLRLYFNDYEVPRLNFGSTKVFQRVDLSGLREAIRRVIARALEADKDHYNEEAGELNMARILSSVIIKTSRPAGGCSKHKDEIMTLTLANDVKCEVFNPCSKDNNCGLNIYRHINSNLGSAASLRKKYGLKSGSHVHFEKMVEIANEMKVEVLLFDNQLFDIVNQKQLSKEEISESKATVKIILNNEHYYLYKGFTEQKYCQNCKRAYLKKHTCSEARIEHIKQQAEYKKRGSEADSREIVYFAFDLETRPDYSNYSLVGDVKFYKHYATLACVANNSGVRSFLGMNCIDEMLNYIKGQLTTNQRAVLHAHNGSRFDNYFVLDYLMKDPKFWVNDALIKGSRLLSMRYDYGLLTFLDSYNILSESLESLCKGFKVPVQKIKELEVDGKIMSSMQICLYRKDLTPIQWIDYLQKVNHSLKDAYIEYCNADAVSLYQLMEIAASQINKLAKSVIPKYNLSQKMAEYVEKRINVREAVTLSGFSDKLFKDCSKWMDSKGNVRSSFWAPVEGKDDYAINLISRSKCGGISEVFQAGIHTGNKGENVCCFDVVSLYASCMQNCDFPDPKEKPTDTKQYIQGKFGVYLCRNIKQATKVIMDYPASVEGRRDWKQPSIAEAVLTNIDIDRMLAHGSTMDIIEGIYWEKKAKVFNKVVGTYNAEKMRQDQLKKEKSPDYNEALRTASKFMANSLFGRQLMEIETSEYLKVESVEDVIHEMASEFIVSNGDILAKVPKEKKYGTIQLGTFILAHSRDLMQKYFDIVGRENVIATETDSIYTSVKAGQRLIDAGVVKKELGFLEQEFSDCEKAIFTGKKQYYVKNADEGGKLITKMKCKGIPKASLSDDAENKFIHLSEVLYEELLDKGVYHVANILQFKRDLFHSNGSGITIGRAEKRLTLDAKLSYFQYFHTLQGVEVTGFAPRAQLEVLKD